MIVVAISSHFWHAVCICPKEKKKKKRFSAIMMGVSTIWPVIFALGMLVDMHHSTLPKVLCALQTWD